MLGKLGYKAFASEKGIKLLAQHQTMLTNDFADFRPCYLLGTTFCTAIERFPRVVKRRGQIFAAHFLTLVRAWVQFFEKYVVVDKPWVFTFTLLIGISHD